MIRNLSLDEIFHVMEFLPINELPSALLVCKEWNSLDEYEPFWKTILEHYLVSNIIDVIRRMKTDHGVKNRKVDEENIHKLWNGDLNDKFRIISDLKRIRSKDRDCYCKMDRTLLKTFIGSFTNHILKDKRKSLQKFILNQDETIISQDSERTFKYITEKQIFSNMSIMISSYFDYANAESMHYYEDSTFIQSMISSLTGKKYQSSDETNHSNDYMYSIGKKLFTFFFKYHEKIEFAEKYWNEILSLCINYFPLFIVTEDDGLELILKHMLGFKFTKPFDLELLEGLFFNGNTFEFFQNKNVFPLIIQIFERNEFVGEPEKFSSDPIYSMDSEKFCKRFEEFLECVKKFTNLEMVQRYEKIVVILGLLCNREILIDELLNQHPIDLLSISCDSLLTFCITDQFLLFTKKRGILLPLEYVSNLFRKSVTSYEEINWKSLRYILDHYSFDIYELEKEFGFFIHIFKSYYYIVKVFEILFHDATVIEWEKLAEINNGDLNIREKIDEKVIDCFIRGDLKPLSIMKKCFKPDVFNMDLLDKVFTMNFTNTYNREEMFNLTMFCEKVTLREQLDKMQPQDWMHFKEIDFRVYDKSDPKYLIALYNYVHEKHYRNFEWLDDQEWIEDYKWL